VAEPGEYVRVCPTVGVPLIVPGESSEILVIDPEEGKSEVEPLTDDPMESVAV
jgi:hypothetical protein